MRISPPFIGTTDTQDRNFFPIFHRLSPEHVLMKRCAHMKIHRNFKPSTLFYILDRIAGFFNTHVVRIDVSSTREWILFIY
jgi:hypothetical protein